MPNWCEGVLKIRGTKPKIAKYLQENLTAVDWWSNEYKTNVEYNEDGLTVSITDEITVKKKPLEELAVKPKPTDLYIRGTHRAFIESDQINIEFWTDDDDQEIVVTLDNFKQAWVIRADNFVGGAKAAGVDLHIFGFEMGMEYTQEVEIIDGEITINEETTYNDYAWEVPFENLGG